MKHTEQVVKEIVEELYETSVQKEEVLTLDSFTWVILIEELERAFELRIELDEIKPENFSSVRVITQFIQDRQRVT
ncbi:MAG: hypothetical protein CL920_35240 [Deltaproteobacteria bacterium]|nr:hypothetical protein [Deltaproteobacteria bacterium]MBU53979.1 hypothetical protein [Deltaproteobacteria bacterium]|tara:strand:+ start:1825 stop:2052 length:228 start_codon:yes stop_codon:yes gene_type:complete